MIPAFSEAAARHRWDAYFTEVDRLLAHVGALADGLGPELRRHVLDSMAAAAAADGTGGGRDDGELARLDGALARLGRPADYLGPLIAMAARDRSARVFRPRAIARRLRAGLSHAATALMFGTGHLLLAVFVAMALLKPLWTQHVGLFQAPDGTFAAGIVRQTFGTRELLGWWTVPLALALAVGCHLLLKLGRHRLRPRGGFGSAIPR